MIEPGKDVVQLRAQRTAREIAADRLSDKLRREFEPRGQTAINNAFADPKVVEIMLNEDGMVLVDMLGEGMVDTGMRMNPIEAENLIGTIAASLNATVDANNPTLEGELPNGSRFAGMFPPVVAHPTFSIRKRAALVFTLDDYVERQIMAPHYAQFIRTAVEQRKNILIVGSTGSGKTTLANAILDYLSKIAGFNQRVLIIEDSVELQCSAPNKVQMRESPNRNMTQLLRHSMRHRPDRIVVGEVRGQEALALLKAWNTGHPGGIATVHANGAYPGLIRLEQLIQEANVPPAPALIAEAVNVIVFIQKDRTAPSGRLVKELVSVSDRLGTNGEYIMTPV